MVSRIYSLDDAAALERWRALWENAPQRSCFSTPAYVRAAAAAFGLQAELHLTTDDEGADAAGALVFWRKRGPYREAVVPPFTPYTPVVLPQPLHEADVPTRRSAVEAILQALETRYDRIRLFCPALDDVRPARWRGWQATPYYSYQLDLGDGGDLLRAWSDGARRRYRKHAEAYDVREDAGQAAALVKLVAQSYGRHSRPLPAPPAQMQRLVEGLIEQNLVRVWTATPHGAPEPEGAVGIAHDGQTAGYWLVGSIPGPAMTVLLGDILNRLKTEGFRQFDFIGANTPSIATFKRQFGGVLTTYYYLETITRPELRLLRRLLGS